MSILSNYQRFCRRLNYQYSSESIREKRKSKFEDAWITKDREIFKINKRKLSEDNYAKIIMQKLWNTRK